jgi:tRNA(fMet)-specific endonuclease VapC
MADYLLDTNHATHLLGGSANLLRRVAGATHGVAFGISMTVLGELFYAAYASQRREDNLRAVRAFAADSLIWPYDEAAAEEFGRIQAEQKTKGRPIPSADAQIAAVARLHSLIVLSADHHIQFLNNLTVENWLA